MTTRVPASLNDFIEQVKGGVDQSYPGFRQLHEGTKAAVVYFSTVWGLFEFKALRFNANRTSIRDFAERAAPSHEQFREFQPAFDYFVDRYRNGHQTNDLFGSMVGWDTEIQTDIRDALLENTTSVTDKLIALLLIAYCFRNNLFHGKKWAWGLDDQYENLATATLVLVEVLRTFEYAFED